MANPFGSIDMDSPRFNPGLWENSIMNPLPYSMPGRGGPQVQTSPAPYSAQPFSGYGPYGYGMPGNAWTGPTGVQTTIGNSGYPMAQGLGPYSANRGAAVPALFGLGQPGGGGGFSARFTHPVMGI